MKPSALTGRTFSSSRHATHYWDAGPPDGPLMIFLGSVANFLTSL
jgi:hypothetical protein